MSKEDAEIIRKLYHYKKLIREGKLNLPIDVAKKFIGPDTAYHLYSKGKFQGKNKSKAKKNNQ